jgi:hypothetical protein
MRPKKDVDPMFQVDRRRRFRPIVTIGALAIVAAVSGLSLRAGPIPSRRSGTFPGRIAPMPAGPMAIQGPVQNPRAGAMQPRDHFVIVAPAELDTAMVVRAREDLDVEMVVDPETWRRRSHPTGPATAVSPYMIPGPVPAPVEPWRRR